jgi:hypothetical protein
MARSLLHHQDPVGRSAPTSSLPADYLTDGTHLYRVLGGLDDGLPKVVALEDCHSLNVTLVQAAEVGKLRAVTPATSHPDPAETRTNRPR